MEINKELIIKIRRELKTKIEPDFRDNFYRFFKKGEQVKILGVRNKFIKKIAGKYFLEIKNWPKKEIFNLSEELLKSGINEEITVGFNFAYRLKKHYETRDFKIFERWFKNYVSNWAVCDDICSHILGEFIFKFPEFLPKLKIWAKSKNRWQRRASSVVLIYSLRRRKYLKEAFKISDILLCDKNDVVLKGYGWTLKEASKFFQKDVFEFVEMRKSKMPRVALRYAIEKMPFEFKKQTMNK